MRKTRHKSNTNGHRIPSESTEI